MHRLAVLLALLLAGCSLGGGKSGGPRATAEAPKTVTLRFASADDGAVTGTFISELSRVSGGRLRAVAVPYDDLAPDIDQRIAHDVAAGKLDVADVAVRAWESLGVTGLRAFQSPWLISSDALLDRALADERVTKPLLSSLRGADVVGLALSGRGVRYLFARKPLDRPDAFAGARVRVNAGDLTANLMAVLGASATTDVRSGPAVAAALRAGRLDAVESNMRMAVANDYVRAAPYLSPPLYAKTMSLVVGAARLRTLPAGAEGWLRMAAARAASAQAAGDDRNGWVGACAIGLKPAVVSPARLDALHEAVFAIDTQLDADPASALAIDRIGLLATEVPERDGWARCGGPEPESPTKALDGVYETALTQDDLNRTGTEPGNDGDYRIVVAHGRIVTLHLSDPPQPDWPGWDFARDPVAVGFVRLDGDKALMRPATSIRVGSVPDGFRFELFRDRLRWRAVDGFPDDAVFTRHPWKKVG
jgi:TRAP-type C4-dicarboxylate transport system substrate-binding protein